MTKADFLIAPMPDFPENLFHQQTKFFHPLYPTDWFPVWTWSQFFLNRSYFCFGSGIMNSLVFGCAGISLFPASHIRTLLLPFRLKTSAI